MDFTSGECIAGDDRVIHKHHLDSKTVLLGEDTVRVWLRAPIRGNDRQPTRPDVVGKAQDLLVGVPLVLADTLHGRKPVAWHVLVFADRGHALRVGRLGLRCFRDWAGRRSTAANSSSAHHIDAGSDKAENEKNRN